MLKFQNISELCQGNCPGVFPSYLVFLKKWNFVQKYKSRKYLYKS